MSILHPTPRLVDRRSALRSLVGVLALPLAGHATTVEPAPAGDPVGLTSFRWHLDGGPVATHVVEVWTERGWACLDPAERPEVVGRLEGYGRVRLRPLPRWEALDDDPVRQPAPVDTRVIAAGDEAIIARTWAAGDVDHCRLCRRCTACPMNAHPGLMACSVLAPAGISEADAASYSEEAGR